ncbi:MAG: hypothetical protein E6F98_15130, partial [Actinobacteria bacterium]
MASHFHHVDPGGNLHMNRVLALIALAALAVLMGASAASSSTTGLTNPKHFFWAAGQSPQGTAASTANDLIYHGGSAGAGAIGVETKPAVYLVYWGPQWAQGFQTADTNGQMYSS